jgi:hypothetical protein
MRSRHSFAAAVWAVAVLAAGAAAAGPKCGGDGGTRTQTFTCATGELLTRVAVDAGMYPARLSFGCGKIGGSDPTDGKSSGFLGGPKPSYSSSNTSGSGTCIAGEFVRSLETKCGWYVDRVTEIICGAIGFDGGIVQDMSRQSINVGGTGGTRTSLQCPKGKAIYKVRVKSGQWIDSIEVFCRHP